MNRVIWTALIGALAAMGFYGIRTGDVTDAEAARLEWLERRFGPLDAENVRLGLATIQFVSAAGYIAAVFRRLGVVGGIVASFALLLSPPLLFWLGRETAIAWWSVSFLAAGAAANVATRQAASSAIDSGHSRILHRAWIVCVAVVIAAMTAAIFRIATVHFFMEWVQGFLIVSMVAGGVLLAARRRPSWTAIASSIVLLAGGLKTLHVHAILPERDQWGSIPPLAHAAAKAVPPNAVIASDDDFGPAFRRYFARPILPISELSSAPYKSIPLWTIVRAGHAIDAGLFDESAVVANARGEKVFVGRLRPDAIEAFHTKTSLR